VRSKDSILNSLTVGIQRNLYAPLAGIDALTTSFQVSESDDIVKGLQIALVELRKISLWGFTNEELDLAKHLTVQNFKDQYMNPTSSTLKRELMEVYLTGGAFRKDIFSFLSSLTNEITLNEINALIDEWAAQENNTNVVVSLENQALLDVPTITGEIIRTVKEVRMRPVPRYISTHKELAAVPNVTVSYSVLSSTESDVVRIKLDNGIKVLFKKLTNGTTDDHDLREIYIHGFDETPQNVNLGPPSVTRDVILQAYNFLGVDGLNYSELQEWKRQKNRVGNLDGVPYIKENEHGIKGEASFNNYQALLLLIYHYFTTAHIDTLEVEKWIARATEKSKNPYKIVDDSIKAIISPQNIPSKEFKVNNAQIKSILEMYNQIISNSGNLTFVIAGSFSFDEIIKSTVNYLGSIPRAPNRKSNPKRASTIRPAKQGKPQDIGNTRLTLVEDSVGNVSVRMVFGASSGGNELDQLKLQILNEALRSRLMQRLRVEEQAVYDVYSRLKPRNEAGYYAIDVSFQTQPKDVARSTHFVVDEISKLTEVNMDVQTFRNSVAYIRSRIQMQRDSPDYWINSLIAKEKHNRAATDGEAFLDGLTPSDLKLAAAEMISVKKYAFFEIL
jgi:zinc protease